MMRQVDPFSYYVEHASAIAGLGGPRRSPDPQYCFHTNYHEMPPGAAAYELRLSGVRASQGELSLRIHAYKPSTGDNASLVAGSRLYVAVDGQQDLSIRVKFFALRDVTYAFYGHFTEYSDIVADALEVVLHEPEEGSVQYIEPPVSMTYKDTGKRDVRPANVLVYDGKLNARAPVSQDFTLAQIPDALRGEDGQTAWCEAVGLNALQAYGIGGAGLDVLTIGALSDEVRASLKANGFILQQFQDGHAECEEGYFSDILLWPDSGICDDNVADHWGMVQSWLGHLKVGGLAVIGLRYRIEDELLGMQSFDRTNLSRNEIGRWALRLIGMGYSVAPLAFAPHSDLALTDGDLAAFCLIVRRQ